MLRRVVSLDAYGFGSVPTASADELITRKNFEILPGPVVAVSGTCVMPSRGRSDVDLRPARYAPAQPHKLVPLDL